MPLAEGQDAPSVTFKCRVRDDSIDGDNPFTWKDSDDVTTEQLLKGKCVVVFAVPGAFTPTCSSAHLPGYEKHYEAIKACGVDEIQRATSAHCLQLHFCEYL
jgi:peroxiredoxin